MKDDLIFHLVTKKDWTQFRNSSTYTPESIENQGFIHCSKGHQLEETANQHFAGEDHLLLLVINVALVDAEIKYENDEERGEEFPHIYGPLNTGAVIDKIDILPEKDGKFLISFESVS